MAEGAADHAAPGAPVRTARPVGRNEAARATGSQRLARRLDLDRAKGVAILLVVAGHIVARDAPAGVEWYDPLRYLVYRFHMPFFLYLSGYVVWLTGAALTPVSGWPDLLWRRATRLLLPFLLFGLAVLLGKLAAMHLMHVDNAPQGLFEGLRNLVWTTRDSPATMIWFLWVLFLCTAIAPAIAGRLGSFGLVALGLALQFVELPPIAYLDKFGRHFLFFALGCWIASREDQVVPAFSRFWAVWWAAFALSLWAAHRHWLDEWWSLVVCGVLAIPALHGAVRLPPLDRARWPLFLGRYSMVIYLFNTIAIGLTKAVLIALGVAWTAAGFALHLPALMVAGVAGPILLKVLLLRRSPVLDRMTD